MSKDGNAATTDLLTLAAGTIIGFLGTRSRVRYRGWLPGRPCHVRPTFHRVRI